MKNTPLSDDDAENSELAFLKAVWNIPHKPEKRPIEKATDVSHDIYAMPNKAQRIPERHNGRRRWHQSNP